MLAYSVVNFFFYSSTNYDSFFQMLSFMHAHSTYFHQGHDLFNEFEPEMKSVNTLVSS